MTTLSIFAILCTAAFCTCFVCWLVLSDTILKRGFAKIAKDIPVGEISKYAIPLAKHIDYWRILAICIQGKYTVINGQTILGSIYSIALIRHEGEIYVELRPYACVKYWAVVA